MAAQAWWLGIDVAKQHLDCWAAPDGTSWRVANDSAGWAELTARVVANPPAGIVLEATGRYEQGVVQALHAAGLPVVVMNPLTIRRYAQGLGRKAKSDRLDAELLARYAQHEQPAVRSLPTDLAVEVRDLLARREQLTEMVVMEKNRLQQASPVVAPFIRDSIAALTTQIAAIESRMRDLVAQDPSLQHRVTLLDSVPGIGILSATRLAIWLPELGTLSGREVAALAGLAPFACDSGQFRGQRHISGGRSRVRTTRYHIMTSTKRWNPTFHAHDRQLKARGKAPKVAQVACMRRLLGILNAMIRDDLAWTQTQVGQGAFCPIAA